MKLSGESEARAFDTREACQEWIHGRVIRFKLAMEHVLLPDGSTGVAPKKVDGRILDARSDGYKSTALDEPLKNYAKPVRRDGKWLAVVRYGE